MNTPPNPQPPQSPTPSNPPKPSATTTPTDLPPVPPDTTLNSVASSPPPTPERRGSGRLKRILVDIFSWIVIPGLIVLLIHSFVFQAFYVQGTSMVPSFANGDYLVISKIAITTNAIEHTFGSKSSLDLKRGDVLVFRYPAQPSTFFVKRLIGLPGDRVVVKDGQVKIYDAAYQEGFVLKEPYIDPSQITQGNIDEIVADDSLFVMGDNRSPGGSFDSREWGQLPQKNVVGKAELRLLPLNTFGLVPAQGY